MQVIDVIKIADIDIMTVSPDMYEFICEQGIIYRDQLLDEHLYSVDALWESLNGLKHPFKKEFKKFKEICDKYDCAYFRMIKQ